MIVDTIQFECRYLPLNEAARFCGLSTKTLRRWVLESKLTAFRPTGTKILVNVKELDALIRSSATPT